MRQQAQMLAPGFGASPMVLSHSHTALAVSDTQLIIFLERALQKMPFKQVNIVTSTYLQYPSTYLQYPATSIR